MNAEQESSCPMTISRVGKIEIRFDNGVTSWAVPLNSILERWRDPKTGVVGINLTVPPSFTRPRAVYAPGMTLAEVNAIIDEAHKTPIFIKEKVPRHQSGQIICVVSPLCSNVSPEQTMLIESHRPLVQSRVTKAAVKEFESVVNELVSADDAHYRTQMAREA